MTDLTTVLAYIAICCGAAVSGLAVVFGGIVWRECSAKKGSGNVAPGIPAPIVEHF